MTAIATRRVAGAATLVVLVYLVQVALFAPGARANHIPDTGPVPGNCVEFQVNTEGAKVPESFTGVTITVTDWDEDEKGFDFTVSGLTEGQYVDISVKSGQEIDEPGPYGNGSFSFSHERQFAISHIRVCVFEDLGETTTTVAEETTTTEDETTTTEDETTTTTEGSTTTSGGPTTTISELTTTTEAQTSTSALGQTTTTEVGASTTAVEQTTTSEDEEDPAATGSTTPPEETSGTLPFTGSDPGAMIQLGLLALLTGAALLFLVTGREEEAISVDRPSWS